MEPTYKVVDMRREAANGCGLDAQLNAALNPVEVPGLPWSAVPEEPA